MRSVALFFVLALLLSACTRRPVQQDLPRSQGNSVDHSGMRNSTIESSPNAATAPYELQFLDTMIAQDEVAIDMAQLAQTRSGRDAIKTFALDLISARRNEITEMRELRGRSFSGSPSAINTQLPGMADAFGAIDLEKLDDLKEKPFDLEFIRQQLAASDGCLRFAREVIAEGSAASPPIRQLAQELLDRRNREITQMHEWQ